MACTKTIYLLIVCILVRLTNSSASPAYPGLINFVQPDGSKINIYLKGDERVKWAETEDGYSILFNANGTYEYAVLNNQGNMVPSGKMAKNVAQRSTDDLIFLLTLSKHLIYSHSQVGMAKQIGNILLKDGYLLKAFPTKTLPGETAKLLCILIGFTDRSFEKTKADFDILFNQASNTVNFATGSVKKFFYESSYNQLNLSVTVVGPYPADNDWDYYGANDGAGNDLRPEDLVTEAVIAADADLDYAEFASDGKTVDGVYVIFAGFGEEAGGGANCIWAHAGSIPTQILDGVNINRYSCSPELSGASGTDITNIGVICHEFGHILGAPDFYDTDYEDNGQYPGTGYWDLQSSGMWNNAGKTPAQPNAYTKCYVYNWATAKNIITSSLPVTIKNSSVTNEVGSFYRMNTPTPNEYFLFENRQQVGFDASLPGHGMLVYHVDSAYIASHSGSINAGNHQGMYIVSANSVKGNGVTISAQSLINTSGCAFPGTASNTSFTDATTPHSNSWAGANTKIPITNITENFVNKTVSFNYSVNTCTPPVAQATGIFISAVTSNSMTVSWIRGSGNKVLVVARASDNDNTNPADGSSYNSPNPHFGSGNEIGNYNYVVYNESGSTVNVTGLRSGIDYYYSIYEYNSDDNCYKTPALTNHALTSGGLCASSGNTSDQTSITRVVFNTIDKASAKPSGYSNYTSVPTSVVKNSAYSLNVNLNTDGDYTVSAFAWIDWNHNNSFDDVGEVYDLGNVYNKANGKTSKTPLNITIPSDASEGVTRMRISCKFYIAPNSCETDFLGEVEDYELNVAPPVETTWIGNSSEWNTNTNWSSNIVPQFNYNVTIPDVASDKFDPIIGTDAVSHNLTIQSGGVLTIGTSGSLTVNGNLTKDAVASSLVLKSISTGTGSLKVLGSVTGSATVERFMTSSIWHIVSVPAVENINTFLNRNLTIPIVSGGGADNGKLGMTDYSTTGNDWNDYYPIGESESGGSFISGKGYMVRTVVPDPTILDFKGSLFSGYKDVTVSLVDGKGWNCIGNPYSSAIKLWDGTSADPKGTDNFLEVNIDVIDDVSYGAYLYTGIGTSNGYTVINYATPYIGVDTYASIGQGFFVKAKSNGAKITFTPIMQFHIGEDEVPYKAAVKVAPSIKLMVTNGVANVSTDILFIDGTTTGLDKGYDAGILKSDPLFSLYTKLVDDIGAEFQLQCLPTNQYDKLVIPIGIDSKAGGEVVFSVETIQLDPNCRVILEDKLTNTFTNLSKDTYKTTVANNNSVSDRFFLHTADIVSGLEDQEISTGKLRAYAVGNLEIRVIGEVSGMSVATLYNGLGKVVLTKKLSAGNLNIIGLPNLGSGVYFLNINDKGTTQTIKVMVRK